jgi:RNA polymerase sigma-70 factor, ECF subfamily
VTDVGRSITAAYRDEWGVIVATLARRFGDLDLAEESTAEAFAIAVERWPSSGTPPNPGGWLTVTATRKAIDRLRREHQRAHKHQQATMLEDQPPTPPGVIDDDRLRLMFTCCHPALAIEARVALTLRLLGGLTVAEIARAFVVPTTTIEKRITRAKAKIEATNLPFRTPTEDELTDRLSGVLAVLYLVFNEGYLATGPGTEPVRADLTAEAIRLTRLVTTLVPDDGEAAGLLALMLLTEARRTARVSIDGELITLAEQDRNLWDATLIAEGHRIVRYRLESGAAPGRYQILAAINAVHTDAAHVNETDWAQIVALYDQLLGVDPSPIVALNRAIALAELDGADVALAVVDGLDEQLATYRPYHTARAELLRRLGRTDDAITEYDHALAVDGNTADTSYLYRRRRELTVRSGDTASSRVRESQAPAATDPT